MGFLLLLHRGSYRRPVSLTGGSQGICRADGVSGITQVRDAEGFKMVGDTGLEPVTSAV